MAFTTTVIGRPSSDSADSGQPANPSYLPLPPRTNYNLRGHRAQVIKRRRKSPFLIRWIDFLLSPQISLVRWNEPYQKLATCDASGIIFVWIRYEGRWSIELINDRNTPVTHFSWSHDGRMAVIAYQVYGFRPSVYFNWINCLIPFFPQDGFVLVGSVAGQRYWSTVLGQDVAITTGTWTPDDTQVYLGTASGSIVVLDVHNGAVVAQIQMGLPSSCGGGIRQLAWNCPRFKMEEPAPAPAPGTASTAYPAANTVHHPLLPVDDQQHVLAVLTSSGRLSLIKSFDDVQLHPVAVEDETLAGPMMEWNNDGELLCLAGHIQQHPHPHYTNVLQFFNSRGVLRFRIAVPFTQSPITSLTWGHNDRRLFVATGCQIHVAWVSPRRMASLQHLARLRLRKCLKDVAQMDSIMPRLLRDVVAPLFSSTILVRHPQRPSRLKGPPELIFLFLFFSVQFRMRTR